MPRQPGPEPLGGRIPAKLPAPIALIPLRSPLDALRPTAIALGSFDGLHRGHRRVIEAIASGGPSGLAIPTVVSFWPHPREVLYGDTRLRLDLPEEKLELLEPLGVRQLVLVPFNRELAALTPESFVEQVLVGQLQASCIAVGDNFRFGAGRSGDSAALARLAEGLGVRVSVLPMLWDGAERVSSSRIRRALAAGDIGEAQRLLERPYRFSGVVVQGRGLGSQLGWPTANLQVDGRKFLPREGVYAAWTWVGGRRWAAVMNLGPQPTVDPTAPSSVEVHLLDCQRQMRGELLKVEPLVWIRSQQRFENVAALSDQIGRDAELSRRICQARADNEQSD